MRGVKKGRLLGFQSEYTVTSLTGRRMVEREVFVKTMSLFFGISVRYLKENKVDTSNTWVDKGAQRRFVLRLPVQIWKWSAYTG